jgi:hypothetical protein
MAEGKTRQHQRRPVGWQALYLQAGRAALLPFLASRAIVTGALLLARFLVTAVRPRSSSAAAAAAR